MRISFWLEVPSIALKRKGTLSALNGLEELTVEQALEIPGFSMQSLMDFLGAIDGYLHRSVPDQQDQSRRDKDIVPVARILSTQHSFLEDELRARSHSELPPVRLARLKGMPQLSWSISGSTATGEQP